VSHVHKLQFVALCVACCVLAYLVPAPFLRWTLLGSLLLFWRAMQTGRRELWICGIVAPILPLVRGPILGMMVRSSPVTCDAALARFGFGLEPMFYHWCAARPDVWAVLSAVYYCVLPFWLSVIMAWEEA
jgi:hypothetical protein